METILSSTRTVFTIQTMRMMTGCEDGSRLTKSLHYYSKAGKIFNPRKGIYTKSAYDEKEMACSLFRPAYISLEYVLQRAGVIFQFDEAVTCVSYLNRAVDIDGKTYRYRIIRPELWIGMEGMIQNDNICMATPERAFLDMVYLSSGNCYFDNLNPLDKSRIKEFLPLYDSRVLVARVTELLNLKA
ncbi:MAG: hypothetical protein MJZ90_03405 [Bacteroidales bacterium]|nr:hypothetical protein [Bacteroidales bacterium]